jgi:hypothetical protein
MLRRFELFKDCGIFEDYRWDAAIPDFERINLIYGANDVGKRFETLLRQQPIQL